MDASVAAVAVALIVAAAGIGGPMLLARQQNRHLARISEEAAKISEAVGRVEQMADGNLTAAYRAEYAAVEAQIVAMRRPSPDTSARIAAAEARLAVMGKALEDRESGSQGNGQQLSTVEGKR